METGALTWRALRREDAPALARARAVVEAVNATGEHFAEQDVRDELEDELIDLGRDTLGALVVGGGFVAFARVHGSAEVGDVDRVYVDGAGRGGSPGRGRSGRT